MPNLSKQINVLQVNKCHKKYNDFNIEVTILYPEDTFKEEIEKVGIPVWGIWFKL